MLHGADRPALGEPVRQAPTSARGSHKRSRPGQTVTGVRSAVRRVSALAGRSVPTRQVLAGPFAGKEIAVEVDDNLQLRLEFTEDGEPATYADQHATH